MKNIAIFCDGTWQHLSQRHPTNIALMARSILPQAPGGTPQTVYYDDGVGVGDGVLNHATHILGGALGSGLEHKILRAYEILSLNYQPGDRIFIFGFSRGAYTARSLAGLLRWLWIPKRENVGQVEEALRIYRTRPRRDEPQWKENIFQDSAGRFRDDYCHPGDTFLENQDYHPQEPASLKPKIDKAWIAYVGVLDTVGALGLPYAAPLAGLVNTAFSFHDASLSKMVRSARHAVSIDERRDTFPPTLWDNISAQNRNAGAQDLPADQRPYQQHWFPGHHGAIGGGGEDGGLSLAPMLWVAQGAARAGLAFDQRLMKAFAAAADCTAYVPDPAHNLGSLPQEVWGMSDRAGPDNVEDLSLAARLRWIKRPDYRSAPLRRPHLLDALNAPWPPGDDNLGYWP